MFYPPYEKTGREKAVRVGVVPSRPLLGILPPYPLRWVRLSNAALAFAAKSGSKMLSFRGA